MLRDALNFFMIIGREFWNNIADFVSRGAEPFEWIVDFLFPPVCGICGKFDKNWICKNCYKSLRRLKKCDFLKKEAFYDELFYMFSYKGIIRNLILQYKFQNKAYLSTLFANVILKDKNCCRKIEQYDIMIPVPMFEKKKKQRGYNQTELIAEFICKNLKIDLDISNLIKIKNTKTQSTLSGLERKENIKNAFFVNNKEEIKNKKIIVFDDIFTTGETVNEISRILKQAGAKEILVFVLAKD